MKKVLISAFFCVCLSSPAFAVAIAEHGGIGTTDLCTENQSVENGVVHHITDGDTLVLTNGDRVRLLGINTPEVDFRNPQNSQPLAISARASLQQLLPDGSQVTLYFDQRKKDRYKRLLAFVHFLDERGNEQDAGTKLLEQGLAWQYLILPNQLCWQNYRQAETRAYKLQKGVWNNKNYQISRAGSISVTDKKRRYKRVKGMVTSMKHSKKNFWYILDDNLWFGIAKKDVKYFANELELIKKGSMIQVSGWLYRSYGEARIKIRHPQAMRLLVKK